MRSVPGTRGALGRSRALQPASRRSTSFAPMTANATSSAKAKACRRGRSSDGLLHGCARPGAAWPPRCTLPGTAPGVPAANTRPPAGWRSRRVTAAGPVHDPASAAGVGQQLAKVGGHVDTFIARPARRRSSASAKPGFEVARQCHADVVVCSVDLGASGFRPGDGDGGAVGPRLRAAEAEPPSGLGCPTPGCAHSLPRRSPTLNPVTGEWKTQHLCGCSQCSQCSHWFLQLRQARAYVRARAPVRSCARQTQWEHWVALGISRVPAAFPFPVVPTSAALFPNPARQDRRRAGKPRSASRCGGREPAPSCSPARPA